MTTDAPALLTLREAAERLGVRLPKDPTRLRRSLGERGIKCERIAGRWYVSRRAFDAYVAQLAQGGDAA